VGKRRIPLKSDTAPVDSLLGKPVEDQVDLHGLDARSAELRVQAFIDRCVKTRPGAVVRIVTGKGNRSEGKAVLFPLVRRLLGENRVPGVVRHTAEPGNGAFLVQTGGER
jgi:DNA-nicking Smr family endonuclease